MARWTLALTSHQSPHHHHRPAVLVSSMRPDAPLAEHLYM